MQMFPDTALRLLPVLKMLDVLGYGEQNHYSTQGEKCQRMRGVSQKL